MIPTIETIVEDLIAGTIDKSLAIGWLHRHAADAGRDLRDEFAAGALQGLIACSHIDREEAREMLDDYSGWANGQADAAYTIADAMLTARAKEKHE